MQEFESVYFKYSGADSLNEKPHVHDNFCEIIQVFEGGGNFMISDNIYPIKYGSVFIINAINSHCSMPKNIDAYTRSKISLDSSYFLKLLDFMDMSDLKSELYYKSTSVYIPLEKSVAMEVNEHFRRIYDIYMYENKFRKALISSELVNIIAKAYKNKITVEPIKNDKTNVIPRILKYIHMNITENITVDDIANKNFISKYYLCRLFRENIGMTIMDYILDRRIALAKKQLVSTKASISSISMSTGFSSFSYFCRIFKNIEGMTPGEFRKKYKTN